MERLYCTLYELLDDMEEHGISNPEKGLRHIRSASQWIERHFAGNFIPLTAEKRYDGKGGMEISVDPLLAVTSLVDDTTNLSSSDYLLYPRNKLWPNGPYLRIRIDPDATTISTWSSERDIVVINGRWGLWEETRSTGATGTLDDEDDTGLLISDDASGIWPGSILVIDNEQVLVEGYEEAVDTTTDVNEAVDSSEEVITLDDGSAVNTGEVIKIEFEQMYVLDVQGNDINVVRGYNGTQKTTHAENSDVYVYRNFTVQRAVNGTTAAAHNGKSIDRYVPPDDINWLCRQMAGLMMKKAKSGYAGKAGNVDLGEVYYYQEFPKTVIERLESNYFIPAV